LKLSADAELRGKLGRAGRERVLAHYTWARRAEQMDAVYRSLPLGK
jgi:glycosyltransferase involved in cell wall biosynthesis